MYELQMQVVYIKSLFLLTEEVSIEKYIKNSWLL